MSSQSSATSSATATWAKVTKTFADFSTGATTSKVGLMTLPKNTAVTGILMWVNTVFNDGSGVAPAIQKIGTTNTSDTLLWQTDYTIAQITKMSGLGQYRPFIAASGQSMSSLVGELTGNQTEYGGAVIASLTVDDTINVTLFASVNFNTFIQGSITFYIKTETLP